MPSWVPDWTRKSPNALPPQFKVPQEFSAPRIRALDNQTLRSTARLSYPLGCVLEVTGRRYGTVWTDRKTFGKALVLSGSAGRATDSNKSDPHVPSPSSIHDNIHWLLNPSQNPGTRRCDGRLDFWGRILSSYHGATPSGDFKTDDTVFRADIPPAFGGFCSNCFEMDQMHWQRIKRAMKLDVNQATEQATKQAMASWDTANWVSDNTISQTTKDTIEKVLEQVTKEAAGQAIRQVTIDSNWVTWANKMAISKSIHQSIKQAIERAMTMTNQPFPDRAIQQATDQHAEVVEEAVNRTIEQANKKVTCCCMSQSSSPGHFDKDELDSFITNMSQYGMGRRIFGTDHSLGLGPTELEDWDEVWTLEGSAVPFILRPVDNHYKLVGACYIHQASQTTDRCSICSHQTVRGRATLPETTQPGTTQPASTRTATGTTTLASAVRARRSLGRNFLASASPDPVSVVIAAAEEALHPFSIPISSSTFLEGRTLGGFSTPLSSPSVERERPVTTTVLASSPAKIKIR
ncbi:hypothetical protein FALCPG4_005702 [Fusarium falciforme]